jgi:threonine dehydratase
MENTGLPRFSDIIAAQKKLKGIVKHTSLEHGKTFSTISGASVFIKLENLQEQSQL